MPGILNCLIARSGTAAVSYATWNPSDIGSGVTLSNGNRTAQCATADELVRATGYKSSGKWYMELTVGTAGHMVFGIANSSLLVADGIGYSSDGHGYYSVNGNLYYPGASYGASYTAGNIISIALDMDAGKAWWAKNGTWQASGDPAAGTNAGKTGLTGSWAVAMSQFSSSCTGTGNWGASAFTYTPPSGFSAWSV